MLNPDALIILFAVPDEPTTIIVSASPAQHTEVQLLSAPAGVVLEVQVPVPVAEVIIQFCDPPLLQAINNSSSGAHVTAHQALATGAAALDQVPVPVVDVIIRFVPVVATAANIPNFEDQQTEYQLFASGAVAAVQLSIPVADVIILAVPEYATAANISNSGDQQTETHGLESSAEAH